MTNRPGFVLALSLASAALVAPTLTTFAVQNPPAQNPPPAAQTPPTGQPQTTGGSQQAAAPGPGRGGRGGSPGAAVYAQFCASCHGPKLEGATGPSLVDDVWTNGSDDKSIATIIRDGKTGTPMIAFKDMVNDEQVRQLVFYLRDQYGQQKGKPPTKVDPQGAIVKSEKQTVKLEVIAKDLETPWGLAFLPDGKLLITERPGRLRILDQGKLLPPVKGTPEVWVRQDGGLFDVEVHPQYAKTGWIYLSYSEPLAGFKLPEPDPNAPPPTAAPGGGGRGGPPSIPSMTVIVRGKIKDNTWVDQQVLFRGAQELYTQANFHYGSRFTFDKAGHLFFSIGDKGAPEAAQDLTKPLGKVHRVNDDGSVPKDNPFVNKPGAVGSIWTYGHRNPQGFAWDPLTGKLWETEHGPSGGDELNLLEAGHNYGWAVVSHGMQPGITKSEQEGMDSPKAYWTPTIAPAGIAFYNGTQYPGWKNSLFVASLGGQHLRRIEISKDTVTHQEVVFNEYGRVRDIVIGPDGLLYLALSLPGQRLSDTTAGVVVRLAPMK